VNPWHIDPLHIAFRLLLALALGGIIGFEREMSAHSAGFRTHILVCIGSALTMLLSEYGFAAFASEPRVTMDPSRLAAQVISGIGFLGAGTIIRNGLSVTGLTTAASLWVVAAIGLASGAGFYFAAMVTCLLAFLSLWILSKVEKRYLFGKRNHQLKINALDEPGALVRISSVLGRRGVSVRRVNVEEGAPQGEVPTMTVSFSVAISKSSTAAALLDDLKQLRGVQSVSYE
jgi:putative Mg2+ transporter-C (MgtC) family protein